MARCGDGEGTMDPVDRRASNTADEMLRTTQLNPGLGSTFSVDYST
jgi:hypothetical protein